MNDSVSICEGRPASTLCKQTHKQMYESAIGGASGTRTLKAVTPNGFQDRTTTSYHNAPYKWPDQRTCKHEKYQTQFLLSKRKKKEKYQKAFQLNDLIGV